jgi:hypothetical protein
MIIRVTSILEASNRSFSLLPNGTKQNYPIPLLIGKETRLRKLRQESP